jgi:hypothetical protein
MSTIQSIIKKISGYYDYNDLATHTTPISIPSTGVYTKLTCDGLGEYSVTDQRPTGMGELWNTTTNQLDFSELNIGDRILIRIDVLVDAAGANSEVKGRILCGIGSGFEYPISFSDCLYKTSGEHQIVQTHYFHITSEIMRDYPAEIQLSSDTDIDVTVNGWAIDINKRSTTIYAGN